MKLLENIKGHERPLKSKDVNTINVLGYVIWKPN